MVRAYTQSHVYQHPWDRVTAASFRKFTERPTTLTHVLDVHTLSRRFEHPPPPPRGVEVGTTTPPPPPPPSLHLTRSITVRSPPLPFILRRILGHDTLLCHCVESTVVDPSKKSMEIVTKNSSLRSIIEVEERSYFEPDPADPDRQTLFRQETRIRCKPFSALAAVAEKVEHKCAERFLQNSAKGREVIERICNYIEKEGSAAAAATPC